MSNDDVTYIEIRGKSLPDLAEWLSRHIDPTAHGQEIVLPMRTWGLTGTLDLSAYPGLKLRGGRATP